MAVDVFYRPKIHLQYSGILWMVMQCVQKWLKMGVTVTKTGFNERLTSIRSTTTKVFVTVRGSSLFFTMIPSTIGFIVFLGGEFFARFLRVRTASFPAIGSKFFLDFFLARVATCLRHGFRSCIKDERYCVHCSGNKANHGTLRTAGFFVFYVFSYSHGSDYVYCMATFYTSVICMKSNHIWVMSA